MASRTLVPHHRGGVCRAEETTEKTSREEGARRAVKLQLHEVGWRWLPGLPSIAGLGGYCPAGDMALVQPRYRGVGRGGLKWLKLQQKRPRFEIRNDSAIPNKEIQRHRQRWLEGVEVLQ